MIFPRLAAVQIIRIYQNVFSFDHGLLKILKPFGQCRFNPTCSEYSCQAVLKYGLIKGGFKSLRRLFRCHPFAKGGHDPLK